VSCLNLSDVGLSSVRRRCLAIGLLTHILGQKGVPLRNGAFSWLKRFVMRQKGATNCGVPV
jgi:hypothetical protein